jgi:concentrative nucleoside transporter, CNT family
MQATPATPVDEERVTLEKRLSISSSEKQKDPTDVTNSDPEDNDDPKVHHSWLSYARLRPFILAGSIVVILGWWISSLVLPSTRHRWCVFELFRHSLP